MRWGRDCRRRFGSAGATGPSGRGRGERMMQLPLGASRAPRLASSRAAAPRIGWGGGAPPALSAAWRARSCGQGETRTE